MKRIHEYKRQLLNILYNIYRYHWIKTLSEEQMKQVVPRVVIFGGKVYLNGFDLKFYRQLLHIPLPRRSSN